MLAFAWTQRFFEAMEPFLERAVYASNLGQEGADRVRAAYGPNYDRLARVKAEYDPANLFRLNHNVTPAGRRNGL
jgi:FAD/FMN-containing dehydrogenase